MIARVIVIVKAGQKEYKISSNKKKYHQKLNHFYKKSRKMTNDFFNHNIFDPTFQWSSSECLTNVTIRVKLAMVTYIHCENG